MEHVKLADLKYKCVQLGIEPIPTRHRKNPDRLEVSVNDCIKAIRTYYIDEYKATNKYSNNLDLMLQIPTPMLCGLIRRQSKITQEQVWSDYDTEWQFQRKYNGVRFLMFWDEESRELSMFSRNTSPETLLPIDFKDNFTFNTSELDCPSFILDLEMVYNNFEDYNEKFIQEEFIDIYEYKDKFDRDKYKFVILDCLYSNGGWIKELSLSERQEFVKVIFKKLKQADMNYIFELVDIKPTNMTKEDYYYSIIDYGGEGVVAKAFNSPYIFDRSNYWLKIKPAKCVHSTISFNDSFDAYVSGYLIDEDTNLINVLLFSVYIDDVSTLVCKLYINKELQYKVTNISESGEVFFNMNFLNKVASFEYDSFTKHYLMIHPKLLYWRMDKSPEDCKYTKEYFNSLI